MTEKSGQESAPLDRRETYTLGYSPAATGSMQGRSAESHASFFLRHIRSGIGLLDCGCGPGTITVGLAAAVAPGQVVGIDLGDDHIARANSLAEERGLTNVRFQTGSVYELPFNDESFDAVFSHAMLEHLKEPLIALKEIRRVLKHGGLVGVRSPDHGGALNAPYDPVLEQSFRLFERVVQHNGGNPFIGRELRGLLNQSGFSRVEASASYECWATPERTQAWAERIASHYITPPFSDQVIELGWADQAELEEMAASSRRWGEHPDAFMTRAWGEAVGWKE